MQAFNILHENGLQNKPFTRKHSPWKRSTKQACHQKKKRSTHKKNKYPRKQSNYKTSLSPKSILKYSQWKRSIKQAFTQKNRKTVYKTNLSPKQSAKLSAGKRMPSVTSKYQTFKRWFTIKWQSCVSRKIPKLPAKMSTVLLYWSGF